MMHISLAARPLRVVGRYVAARLSHVAGARGEGLANLALDWILSSQSDFTEAIRFSDIHGSCGDAHAQLPCG